MQKRKSIEPVQFTQLSEWNIYIPYLLSHTNGPQHLCASHRQSLFVNKNFALIILHTIKSNWHMKSLYVVVELKPYQVANVCSNLHTHTLYTNNYPCGLIFIYCIEHNTRKSVCTYSHYTFTLYMHMMIGLLYSCTAGTYCSNTFLFVLLQNCTLQSQLSKAASEQLLLLPTYLYWSVGAMSFYSMQICC